MKVRFHPDAEAEFFESIEFYADRQPGLGKEFSAEVMSAISRIVALPEAWPILAGEKRRCLTNRFPFGVIYSVEPDEILILAVMHLRRKPDYWQTRV